jgi:hypothetical protein
MSERNSPYFAAGLKDGADDAARSPRVRRGYDPVTGKSWMYRRGFARAFLATRRLARGGTVDASPATLAAMQRGLDAAWTALDQMEAFR